MTNTLAYYALVASSKRDHEIGARQSPVLKKESPGGMMIGRQLTKSVLVASLAQHVGTAVFDGVDKMSWQTNCPNKVKN